MSSSAHEPRNAGQPPAHTNRLIRETSPYLLQHAHNPVDWHPWGPEAFEAARRENRPIFLSVGYSTCYWCHVMERQSFEVQAIAGEMNRRFINIKVDREERPDVDQLYMTAVQVLTRQGGWPMSVFLTPDLRPFYGGTYFPPTDQYGRPGFLTVLAGIDDAWQNRKPDVDKSANQLVQILQRLAEPEPPSAAVTIDADFIADLIERSTADYEPHFGGFGQAPKFPRETLLELLLVYLAQPEPDAKAAPAHQSKIQHLKFQIRLRLFHSLNAMAHGGIRDHLGGGFHRYSTDAKWLVPHFEIMLYDNAMLGWCYAEAYRQGGDARHAAVARGIFDFILREMTSPEGAFYTALDAEVDAQEGLSYLWTKGEVEKVLRESSPPHPLASPPPQGVPINSAAQNAEITRFLHTYGLDDGPNFADPHHGTGTPDKNILYLPHASDPERPGQPAPGGDKSPLLDPGLAVMRQKLYEARLKRKQPLLDTKIITSWNALMIRALAHGGKVLNEPHYIAAAARAAEFMLNHHRRPDGGLLRTSGGGTTREGGPVTAPGAAPPSIPGFLNDYAYLVQAFLALEEADAGKRWKAEAEQLSREMVDRFGDGAVGDVHPTTDDVARRVGTAHHASQENDAASVGDAKVGNAHPTEDDAARRVGTAHHAAPGNDAAFAGDAKVGSAHPTEDAARRVGTAHHASQENDAASAGHAKVGNAHPTEDDAPRRVGTAHHASQENDAASAGDAKVGNAHLTEDDTARRVGTAHHAAPGNDATSTSGAEVGSAHPTQGFFFTEKGAKDLIIRQKVASDSPLPSGNAVAAMAMLSLGQPQAARGTLGVFARQLHQQGEGMSAMIQAALLYVQQHGAFNIGAGDDAGDSDRPISPQQTAAEVVQITAEWTNPMELLVGLTIAPGFHIDAHEPQSADIPLIPTSLSIIDPAKSVESIDYPAGEEQSVAFTETPIRVYGGAVIIAVKFRTPIIGQGVRLSLTYQACDASACLPPVTKNVRVGVD